MIENTSEPTSAINRWVVLLLSLILGTTAVITISTQRVIAQPPAETEGISGPLCRFGTNALEDPATTDLPSMGIGWYMNFRADTTPSTPGGMEYMPTIRLSPSQSPPGYTYTPNATTLQTAITNNPGAKWLISNEPDSIYQDNLTAERYARAYNELYHLIKTADPTAQIIAASIIQATPLRLNYLDQILVSYYNQFNTPMPTDGWSIHNYILREINCSALPNQLCWGAFIPPGMTAISGEMWQFKDHDRIDIFSERIVRFRQWLNARGYNGQPVYLTEYGILFTEIYQDENGVFFTPTRVNNFMTATFDYMLDATDPLLGDPNDGYRLVQQWAWFSTTDDSFNGTLFTTNPIARTVIGDHYATYTSNVTPEIDFYPSSISGYGVTTGTAVTVTTTATIANSGNLAIPVTATVNLYDGDPNSGGTLLDTQAIQLSGCGDNTTLTFAWPNLTPGTHTLYVQVTPIGQTDSNPTNNTASGTILVATEQLYLPVVTRSLPTP